MKKKLSLVLALMMALTLGLAGCGNDDQSGSSQTGEDTSLQDIKDKGTLVMGLDDAFPPMGFRDEDQNIVGFDVDVAKEVANRMGVELVLQPIMDWSANIQELNTKNVDCLWNGLSVSPEREEALTLSTPYMENTQVVVVLADSGYNTLADLKDKTVVVQTGSTAEQAIEKNTEFKDSLKDLVSVADNVKAMMDLAVGGSDAVVMDEVVAKYYMNQEPGKYKVLDETLADEYYAVGFRKGDEALKNEVEKQLQAMAEDGTLAQISIKWFGEDLTLIGK